MIRAVVDLALREKFLVLAIGVMLLIWGLFSLNRLPVEAYPDVTNIHVQVITQWPGHSPEEIEQQITIPIEAGVNGVAHLNNLRSTSLFGLSVIDLTFDDAADNFIARQQVLTKLTGLDLPPNAKAQLGPDSSPVGQIYFYTLTSTNSQYDIMELKALQEQYLTRQFKSVANVADVSTFGGTTREYEVQVDPVKLLSYGLSLSQVEQALASNNVSGAGSFTERGEQSYNIRAVGRFTSTNDVGATVLKSQGGPSIRVRDVAIVTHAPKIRFGHVGKSIRRTDGQIVDEDDVVEGIVLLRKGADLDTTIAAVERKAGELNANSLPPGVRIVPHINRGDLVQSTTKTVLGNVSLAILLITGILFLFLGNARSVFIVVLTIPFSLLFAAIFLDLWHIPVSLWSLGALDIGMVVGVAVLMVENILRHIGEREGASPPIAERIKIAAHQVRRPVFHATAIIIAAHLPILTLERMEGNLFRPMAWSIVFVMLGALIFSLVLAPVLASLLFRREVKERHNPWLTSLILIYRRALKWCFGHSWLTAGVLVGCFAGALCVVLTGGMGFEFLPHLDEGTIWARETLPPSIGPTESVRLMRQARSIFAAYPEVTQVVSQTGRPDDGTNPGGFFNNEYFVDLRPRDEWRSQFRTKEQLIAAMRADLREQTFGNVWDFSQPIQDKIEEAVSGVKGSIVVKLFGDDLKLLEQKGSEIVSAMAKVPGVDDLGLLRVVGQPNVDIIVDHTKTNRFGINLNDIQDATEVAMGGKAVTQILDGDRRFDVVVRYQEPYRQTVQNIAQVQLLAPSGQHVALSELSDLKVEDGASVIYREDGGRYVAIKYSVRGRDVGSTVDEAMKAVAQYVNLPPGYRMEWAGEYRSEKQAEARLAFMVTATILIIFLIVYWAFGSLKWASLVLLAVGMAFIGGISALYLTGTHLSVSSGVGFVSLFGLAAQTAIIMIEYINQRPASRLRPIVLTTLVAALGLLPAALSHGIGSDFQRPLAIVIVGGLIVTSFVSASWPNSSSIST